MYVYVCVCVHMCPYMCVCVFLAVYNKAQAQRISNREFNLWASLAETCVMSHQSLSRQTKKPRGVWQ